jgi:hypothetical protein
MRKLLSFFFALAVTVGASVSASARPGADSNYNLSVSSGGGGGYTGPGVVQSGWVAYYGMRAYNAAYAAPGTNPALQVCDTATGLTCSTINILTTGYADRATAVASAACAVQCSATSLTDQTGNGHTLTNNNVHSPIVLFAGCPATFQMCLEFTVANGLTLATTALTQAQPFTMAFVAERNANFAAFNNILAFGSGTTQFGFNNSANNIYIWGGSSIQTRAATDSALHSAFAVFNAASSILSVDGSSATTAASPGTAGASAAVLNLGNDANGDTAAALFYEGGFIGSALSTGTISSVSSNMHGASGWNF